MSWKEDEVMYMGDSIKMGMVGTSISSKDVMVGSRYLNSATVASATMPYTDFGSIAIGKKSLDEEDVKRLFEEMFRKTKPSVFKLTCQSCGASVEQKLDDHLFKCPYCKSAYYIGTELIRA